MRPRTGLACRGLDGPTGEEAVALGDGWCGRGLGAARHQEEGTLAVGPLACLVRCSTWADGAWEREEVGMHYLSGPIADIV